MSAVQPWTDRKEKWEMPEWMEKYARHVHRNEVLHPRIADAINATANPVDQPIAAIQEANVKAQVYLLERLHVAGLLK